MLRAATLVLLGCAALVSLATGVRHAFQYGSHDLQWMGGSLLAQHIDPWHERLANYPHGFRHFSPPNYLHLLYVLLAPFHSLSFGTAEVLWCIVSIGFSIAAVALLRHVFMLDRFEGLLLLFLLWMSGPFRVVLEVGQISLFELFFFCLTFAATATWLSGVAFGLTSVKYSFSPVAGVLYLLRGRYGVLLIAFAISCLGLLGAWSFVSTPLSLLAREPFLVSRVAVSPGLADLMTFSEFALKPYVSPDRAKAVSYALGLAGSCGYAFLLSRFRLSRRADLVLVSVASLLFFKHLTYDYVFLLVPLAYALTLSRLRAKAPIFAGIFIFWGLSGVLDRAANDLAVSLPRLAVNFALLLAFGIYLTYLVLTERDPAEAAAATTLA